MKHISELITLEERAHKHGLCLDTLARRAGVSRTSVWRWRNGANAPLHTKFTATMAAMTACLAEIEAEAKESAP